MDDKFLAIRSALIANKCSLKMCTHQNTHLCHLPLVSRDLCYDGCQMKFLHRCFFVISDNNQHIYTEFIWAHKKLNEQNKQLQHTRLNYCATVKWLYNYCSLISNKIFVLRRLPSHVVTSSHDTVNTNLKSYLFSRHLPWRDWSL